MPTSTVKFVNTRLNQCSAANLHSLICGGVKCCSGYELEVYFLPVSQAVDSTVPPAGLLHGTELSPPAANYICLCLYLLDNPAPGTAETKDFKTVRLIDVSRAISKSK